MVVNGTGQTHSVVKPSISPTGTPDDVDIPLCLKSGCIWIDSDMRDVGEFVAEPPVLRYWGFTCVCTTPHSSCSLNLSIMDL